MTTRTAAELSLDASGSAVRQYTHAATVHRIAAGQLEDDGWDAYAKEVRIFVALLERAAEAEATLFVPGAW